MKKLISATLSLILMGTFASAGELKWEPVGGKRIKFTNTTDQTIHIKCHANGANQTFTVRPNTSFVQTFHAGKPRNYLSMLTCGGKRINDNTTNYQDLQKDKVKKVKKPIYKPKPKPVKVTKPKKSIDWDWVMFGLKQLSKNTQGGSVTAFLDYSFTQANGDTTCVYNKLGSKHYETIGFGICPLSKSLPF